MVGLTIVNDGVRVGMVFSGWVAYKLWVDKNPDVHWVKLVMGL